MIYARAEKDGREFYGAVDGNEFKVLEGCLYNSPRATGQKYSMSEIKLLSPVKPSKVIGIGLNYRSVAATKGTEPPAEPVIFLKPPSSIIGDGEEIIIPDSVKNPAYEVELAVVIGKKTKNAGAAEALDYVLGYALSNDVTAKDHMIKGQPWTRGKSFDTFTPIGPYIVTGLDPEKVILKTVINGAEKQNGETSDMVFGVKEIIAFVSSIMTLESGDVILTGTPLGGGDLKDGDEIELSSPQIGSMKNKVRFGGK